MVTGIIWENGTGTFGSMGGIFPAPCHPQGMGRTRGPCREPQSSELMPWLCHTEGWPLKDTCPVPGMSKAALQSRGPRPPFLPAFFATSQPPADTVPMGS